MILADILDCESQKDLCTSFTELKLYIGCFVIIYKTSNIGYLMVVRTQLKNHQ